MLKNKKPWVIVVLTTACIAIILGLLCGIGMHKMASSKVKVMKGLTSFVNTTVLPDMKPLRLELNKSLSTEELLKIDELRAEAKVIITVYTEVYEKYHNNTDATEVTIADEDIAKVKQAQKVMRKIITESWVILDSNELAFAKLDADIIPKMEAWHNQLKADFGKYMHHHKGHSKKSGLHKAHAQFGDGLLAPVMFILFEPETNFPFNHLLNSIDKHLDKKGCQKKCNKE